jgi:Flp pilus assembly protein TadD
MVQQRRTLRRKDKYAEAILLLIKPLRSIPHIAKAWNNKGLALKALGRDAEADVAFVEAASRGSRYVSEM